MNNLKLSLSVFRQKFFSKRIGVLFLLMIFIMHIYISPVREYTEAVGYKCSPWLFVHLLGDMFFLVIFFAGCVYYYSNVPFLQKETMYQMIRLGRTRWISIQVTSSLFGAMAITIVFVILNQMFLLPNVIWSTQWGKILYTLALTDAGERYGVLFRISDEIIKKYNPLSFGIWMMIICILTIFLISNIMLCLSLWISRIVAISVTLVSVVMIIMEQNMYLFPKMFWLVPLAWMRIEKWQKVNEPLGTIILFLLIINFVLILMSIFRMQTLNINWSNEEV